MSKHDLTREEVAELIERFVDGGGGVWDWDDFTSGMTFEDTRLREIQARCTRLWIEFPPTVETSYTNAEGIKVLRDYIKELRAPGSR